MKTYLGALSGVALLMAQPFDALGQAPSGQAWEQWQSALVARKAREFETVNLYVKRVSRGEIPGMDGAESCRTLTTCDVVQVTKVPSQYGVPIIQETELSPTEVQVLAGISPDAIALDQIGLGLFEAQGQVNEILPPNFTGLGDAGVPAWLDPSQMLGIGGFMAVGAANAISEAEQNLANRDQLAQADADQIANAMSQLEFAGNETINGIRATAFRTRPEFNTFGNSQIIGDQRFDMTGAAIWIDPDRLNEIKTRFEGKVTAEGQSRDFFLEIVNSDFRNPSGCGEMYKPFRKTMRMGGMLDDAQMAEMEEARAKLAEFDQQMASMPAAQRQMMERMLGPQMDMVRGMANGGAMEMVEQTEEILCNPDLASLFSLGGGPGTSLDALLGSGSGSSLGTLCDDEQLCQIQADLTELGYMPGNTNGVLDTLTQIAISQFEAEQGLEVTGEPSVELATLLADLTG